MTACLFFFIPIKYLSILLSVAIGMGLYFLFLGFRLLARKSSLFAIPSSRICDAAEGLVEVSGLAAGPCTTLAPITGEACFLYRTTAWRQRNGKKNQWEKVADETLHLPFFIDDSTGQMLIEAVGADLELHPQFRGEYDASRLPLDEVPLSVSGFLSRHGVARDCKLRIEEQLIKADDALFIAGTLTKNPDVEVRPSSPFGHNPSKDRSGDSDNLRDNSHSDFGNGPRNYYGPKPALSNSSEQIPAAEIIRLATGSTPSSTREMSQQAKIAAALTRAGMSGPQMWSTAELPRQALAVEEASPPATFSYRSGVRSPEEHLGKDRTDGVHPEEPRSGEQLGAPGFNRTPPVVLMKGTVDTTFVISFRSQKEISSAIAGKAAAMVCGGTTIMLLGLYLLWARIPLL